DPTMTVSVTQWPGVLVATRYPRNPGTGSNQLSSKTGLQDPERARVIRMPERHIQNMHDSALRPK
ncbi:MAG: hypothetical protein WAW96_17975, partial [Alphaproteobacteria bacterium]